MDICFQNERKSSGQSIVQNADKILVVSGGKIAEQGRRPQPVAGAFII